MLVKGINGWYTTNPDTESLLLLEQRQKQRRLIKEHFEVRCEGYVCNLYFHGRYVSSWLRGGESKYRAAMILSAVATMYRFMGGK